MCIQLFILATFPIERISKHIFVTENAFFEDDTLVNREAIYQIEKGSGNQKTHTSITRTYFDLNIDSRSFEDIINIHLMSSH